MSEFEPSSCPVCFSHDIECEANMDGFITEGFTCECKVCGTEWEIEIEIHENITKQGEF